MKIRVGGICYSEIDLGSDIQHDVLQAYKKAMFWLFLACSKISNKIQAHVLTKVVFIKIRLFTGQTKIVNF